MPWRRLVQLNRALEILGKIATTIWVCTIAGIILGLDVRDAVAHVFNAGRPVEGLIAAAIVIPTVVFLLARSAIGYCRWRVQRELWRRDVRRLTRIAQDAGAQALESAPVPDTAPVRLYEGMIRWRAGRVQKSSAGQDAPPDASA